MVTSLVAAKSDAKVASDERAYIVSSAKMHLSIFKAQALYLRETGAQPKEISEMIRGLYDSLEDIPVSTPALAPAVTPAPVPAPAPAPVPAINISPPKPKLSVTTCNPPRKIRVRTDHIPGTQQEALARCDDHVIVYAWIDNETEALAYNPTNKTAGRVPRAVLDMTSNEPSDQDKVCLAKEDSRSKTLGHITWKAGDYIRVWGRVEHSHCQCTGFGFNMASGQIGKFNTYWGGLEPVE